MAGSYSTRFLRGEQIAPGVWSSFLERPDGYAFEAGQYLSLTLATREGRQTKSLTHVSSPADPDLEIATRLTGSAFKDALSALRASDSVGIEGPFGSMTLRSEDTQVALLVGGVGVTPARSIVRDAVQRGTGVRFGVFFGNQEVPGIPYREELDAYAAEHPAISIVHVIALPDDGWRGETGFITADVVRRHVDCLEEWRWLVAGPPAMVDAMEKVVTDLGLPSERVTFERFSGYAP